MSKEENQDPTNLEGEAYLASRDAKVSPSPTHT